MVDVDIFLTTRYVIVEMNGRLVRKTLSYSKQLDALEASRVWEDWV